MSRFLTRIINDPPGKRPEQESPRLIEAKLQDTLDSVTIANESIVDTKAIVTESTIDKKKHLLSTKSIVDKESRVDRVSTVRGFTRVPNELLDNVLRTLSPIEQVLLMRLFRLSHGFKSETCCVGYGTLAKACNISSRQAQRSIEKLVELSWIERVGVEQGGSTKRERGSIYKLNLPAGTLDTVSTVDKQSTVDTVSTNKEHSYKETHNTENVSVGSGFTLTECRRYADSLRTDGITNPGGYATKIHRSGEADDLIAAFLNPVSNEAKLDASQCPDCNGTGYYYPQGKDKGVAKCKHQRLVQTET